jgi:hypothetical protein
MKRAFLSVAGALVAGILGWTPAQAAQVNFTGSFVIVNQSGVCDSNRIGERYSARFRPANLDDNGPDTILTLFDETGFAAGFRRNNGSFTSSFQAVDWVTIGGDFGFDENITVFLRVTTQAPAAINTNTPFLYQVGQILNWDHDTGCAVVFTAGFTRAVQN